MPFKAPFFVWAGWLYFCDAHPLIGSGRWRFIRIPEPKNVMILVVTGMASQVIYPTGSHQPAFLWVMVLGGSMMYLAPQESDSTKLLKLPKKSYQKCPGIPDWKIGREELQKIDVGRKLTDFQCGDQCILVVLVTPGWSRDHKTPSV